MLVLSGVLGLYLHEPLCIYQSLYILERMIHLRAFEIVVRLWMCSMSLTRNMNSYINGFPVVKKVQALISATLAENIATVSCYAR
jgi:hypothetical protein